MNSPSLILRQHHNIKVMLTKRNNGFSLFPPHSFNFSFSVGDNYSAVIKNRLYAAQVLGVPLQNWVVAGQVHSNNITQVNHNHIGSGVFCRKTAIPNTDGLWTLIPRLALVVSTADCLVLGIYDPRAQAIAAIHSGWRGCANGIVPKLVNSWVETLNSRPQDLLVWFGSYLSGKTYEIGLDTAKLLGYQTSTSLPPWFENHPQPQKVFFDQAVFVKHQLLNLGVAEDNIYLLDGYGYQNTAEHFSHRLENGNTGRSILAITML